MHSILIKTKERNSPVTTKNYSIIKKLPVKRQYKLLQNLKKAWKSPKTTFF